MSLSAGAPPAVAGTLIATPLASYLARVRLR
jgi:hypothetical protein